MNSARIMLKARLLANVKMVWKPKGQGKTQVKARIHANWGNIELIVLLAAGDQEANQEAARPAERPGHRQDHPEEGQKEGAQHQAQRDEEHAARAPRCTSKARKLQNPDHIDIVKEMMHVPSARDMGLTREGEEIHDKMVIAATRQLSASTGGQYNRYIARLIKEYRRSDPES